MLKKGDYVRVNEKILTDDQYNPPRIKLQGRYGIIEKEDKNYPSVQFYRYNSRKDPSLPMKVPAVCLKRVTENEFWVGQIE
jgi:hypothetical protein